MYQVTKRDGSTVPFQLSKIIAAMTKAFEAQGQQAHPEVVELLALRVTADFQPKIRNDLIAVEDIQDSVEVVLIQAGYDQVAKAYILYRKQRENVRHASSTLLNYKELVDNYLRINDWRVKENSTVTYSVGGLILSNSGAITANYWLSEIYDQEVAQAHRDGDLHLHDLSMLTGYCAGWSLKQLIYQGLGGRAGEDHLVPRQAPVHPMQPDGELPGHHAKRVGWSPGLLLLRHLSGPLCPGGPSEPARGEAVHPILCLRGEHPQPLGHPGPLYQHHPGLDGAPRSGGTARHCGREVHGLHLWGLQKRDGHGQPGLFGDHD